MKQKMQKQNQPFNLEFISTESMTENDWLEYRKTGIGASEIGTLLGLDNYKSSIELFYEKIGQTNNLNLESLPMFLGKEQESFIADLWEYWDGSKESVILNYRLKKKVRRCSPIKAYIRNKSFPHLFVSLDRIINPTLDWNDCGALEIKTMSGRIAEQWDAGVPPRYIMQLQTQMGVAQLGYGELAILEDNRDFEVLPIEYLPGTFEQIVSISAAFWEKVVTARKLEGQRYEAQRNFNFKLANEMQRAIDALAPEPDGTLAYLDFMRKKSNNPTIAMRVGTESEFELASKHREAKIEEQQAAEKVRLFQSYLIQAMKETQELNFGDRGKITYTKTKNGNRIFKNKTI